MEISGVVKYVDLEGGFWGIQGDDGMPFKVLSGLPESLKQDGLKVSAKVEIKPGMGIAMWGQDVDVLEIRAI